MTPDGEYLSGVFAGRLKEHAKRVLEEGWDRWRVLAQRRGYRPKKLPREPFDVALGDLIQPGGLKLEVAVRDLPRGDDSKPGHMEWHRHAYNLNWLDLTMDEAEEFVTASDQKQRVPSAVLEKLALRTLKDSVRGQCKNWEQGALREGELFSECIKREPHSLTMRLTGFANLEQSGRAYSCRLHGLATYHSEHKRFTNFEIVAVGQRSGTAKANFRQDDPGPAPMGVALVMHGQD